jgi:hypothetical protein
MGNKRCGKIEHHEQKTFELCKGCPFFCKKVHPLANQEMAGGFWQPSGITAD